MAYASTADVQNLVPTQLWTGGAASQPTLAAVSAWLDEETARVDSMLDWKYVTPVTDPLAVSLLQPRVAQLVAARVWNVVAGQDPRYGDVASRMHRQALEMLAYDGKTGQSRLVLPNTTLADTGEAAVLQPEASFTDPDVAGNNPRLFTVTTEW